MGRPALSRGPGHLVAYRQARDPSHPRAAARDARADHAVGGIRAGARHAGGHSLAIRRDRAIDQVTRVGTLLGLSVPYSAGTMPHSLFSLYLRWMPPIVMGGSRHGSRRNLTSCCARGCASARPAPPTSRTTRALHARRAALEYVRTARPRAGPARRHPETRLKNALIPVWTVVAPGGILLGGYGWSSRRCHAPRRRAARCSFIYQRDYRDAEHHPVIAVSSWPSTWLSIFSTATWIRESGTRANHGETSMRASVLSSRAKLRERACVASSSGNSRPVDGRHDPPRQDVRAQPSPPRGHGCGVHGSGHRAGERDPAVLESTVGALPTAASSNGGIITYGAWADLFRLFARHGRSQSGDGWVHGASHVGRHPGATAGRRRPGD